MTTDSKHRLIVNENVKSPIAEAFRTLRTNIYYSKVDGELKTIIFTSAGPGEGKSTVIANTAVALAHAGKKVILMDCDLRKPVIHKIFGKKNVGVTNYLMEDKDIADFFQDTHVTNLRVLTSGPIPPNPSELLESLQMNELLNFLKAQADIVLIDVPPIIAVTDSCVLASRVDGVILVLDTTSVRPEMAQKAKELLGKAKTNILGVILNRVEIEQEYAGYYYYYGNEKKVVRNY